MTMTQTEITARTPIWSALSDLYLDNPDTELIVLPVGKSMPLPNLPHGVRIYYEAIRAEKEISIANLSSSDSETVVFTGDDFDINNRETFSEPIQ
jgi:hypothetical protein